MRFRVKSGNSGVGSKVGTTIFGMVFAGMGGVFLCLMAFSLIEVADRYINWKSTTATVTASHIEEDEHEEDPYALFVAVHYRWGNQEFEKSIEAAQRFGSYDDAEASLANYKQDSQVQVWVDPDNPADVRLKRGDLWILPMMLLPLVFVAVGVGLIWSAWRRKPSGTQPTQKKGKWGMVGLAAFFSVFGVVGIVGFYLLGICPWLEYFDAQGWEEVPCVVETSRVRSHDGDDGTTYSVDILYRYQYEGSTYRSDRYSFVGGSSSGYEGKREVVERHRAGTNTVCYVDPDDPEKAVLVRDFTWPLLFGLFFLPFLLVGVGGGIGLSIHHRRKQRRLEGVTNLSRSAPRSETLQAMEWLPDYQGLGPMELKPRTRRIMKLVGVLFFALLWNGIVSIFVVIAVKSHLSGSPEWFLTFFMIPFVLVGLGAILAVFYQLLCLFNPKLVLNVSNDALRGGETLELSWNTLGRTYRINHLIINLICEERATYQRGTDTMSDTETVASYPLVDTTEPLDIATGQASLALPEEAMHSFVASRNEIQWTLRVKGTISFWPDVKDDYPIVVLPREGR